MSRYDADAHWAAVNEALRSDNTVLIEIDELVSEHWPQLAELFTALRGDDQALLDKVRDDVRKQHETRLEAMIVKTYDRERREWGVQAA